MIRQPPCGSGSMIESEQALATPVAVAPAAPAWRCAWWRASVLVAVVGFLYADTLARMVNQWWNDPNFSHGFFVPLFSAYVVWQSRDRLRSLPLIPAAASGIAVILFSLVLLILG